MAILAVRLLHSYRLTLLRAWGVYNTPRSLYETKAPQQPGYLSPNIIERNVSAFGR